jgi:hypothetical protein
MQVLAAACGSGGTLSFLRMTSVTASPKWKDSPSKPNRDLSSHFVHCLLNFIINIKYIILYFRFYLNLHQKDTAENILFSKLQSPFKKVDGVQGKYMLDMGYGSGII